MAETVTKPKPKTQAPTEKPKEQEKKSARPNLPPPPMTPPPPPTNPPPPMKITHKPVAQLEGENEDLAERSEGYQIENQELQSQIMHLRDLIEGRDSMIVGLRKKVKALENPAFAFLKYSTIGFHEIALTGQWSLDMVRTMGPMLETEVRARNAKLHAVVAGKRLAEEKAILEEEKLAVAAEKLKLERKESNNA